MNKMIAFMSLLLVTSTVIAANTCHDLFEQNQKKSSMYYDQQIQIVEQYQAVGLAVNMFLRTGDVKWSSFMPPDIEIANYIQALDKMIFEASVTQDLTLYRGEAYGILSNTFQVGDKIRS